MNQSVPKALLVSAAILSLVSACAVFEQWPRILEADVHPPQLLSVTAANPHEVRLQFDQPVIPDLEALRVDPAGNVAELLTHAGTLTVRFSEAMTPGTEYWIHAIVLDESENVTSVLVSAYGPNDRVPRLLINEFTCEGSKRHPDMTELAILEPGNLAGVTVYEGTPDDWDSRIVLPPIEVEAGEYVVIHWKPEGIDVEQNEVDDPTLSGGLDATPRAWDVWVSEGDGLPNTTGCLTVCDSPKGHLIDTVLYSAKEYDPTCPNRGFYRARELAWFQLAMAAEQWESSEDFVSPECGIDPTDSTATRSICRMPGQPDTNRSTDWHIVPSGGATLGWENRPESYSP